MADEAVLIGPANSDESYLDIKKIVRAARQTNATMVHPGYGFLSENAKFCAAIERDGIKFVGPGIEAIKVMGDKIKSKKLAKNAGVSVVPGGTGVVKDVKEAVKIAEKIGYPVMVKASAGGGGKGMRVVYKKGEVRDAFETSTNEAQNYFSDGRIFIEKFIENPRHIEIQIIADKQGNIVCLGERECSIQRNNQKVIEEAPSSFIDAKTRKKMYAQSVALAKKVGYFSAGTIEYIMDKKKNFYFLEMNTRLQVEHPVTELVTGIDLVETMINIANDKPLPFKQEDVKLDGWAIESRVYSEDPERGFLPSSGRINKYIEPKKIEGVRVDTGIYEGCEVSTFYDAMIAKLCTHGKNRAEAVERMSQALGSFYINGISHNIKFLETIMDNERWKKGDISTSFIKEEFPEGFSGNTLQEKNAIGILIGVAMFMFVKTKQQVIQITDQLEDEPNKLINKWVVSVDGEKYLCRIREGESQLNIAYDGGFVSIKSSWLPGYEVFRGEINGKKVVSLKILENNKTGDFMIQYMGSDVYVTIRSTYTSELEKFMPAIELSPKPVDLKAPITGKIVKFKIKKGDKLEVGAEMFVVEAMKMENVIRSDHKVRIKKIYFKEGDFIATGDKILDFE
jgi:propionyl-CoA carboxylase alpha chain